MISLRKPTTEEEKRQSYILQVILLGVIVLALLATVNNLIRQDPDQDVVSEMTPRILLLALIGLYIASKKVSAKIPSLFLIGLLSLLSYYLVYQWGALAPQAGIALALTVVMGGILVSSRFSLWLILAHSLVLSVLSYFHISGSLVYATWEVTPTMGSVMVMVLMLGVIGVISWLSNKEIEKALFRARTSEKALAQERDMLEVVVEERTQELREAQLEKLAQFYRFADFGRLAMGLFHDLATPLTTVSLNLEKISKKNDSETVKRAMEGIRRMAEFVEAGRKQVQKQDAEVSFELQEEVEHVIEMITYLAKKRQIVVESEVEERMVVRGNPYRFNQLVTNLVTNAVDSYEKVRRKKNRRVIVRLKQSRGKVRLEVEDFGSGIADEYADKIFDPFFSTKSVERGMGIGLFTCRQIVEEELGGEIAVKTVKGKGTLVEVEFPMPE